jgi:peptidoglycan hydrolase-like protein with peptidoglycan-binding domain
MISDAGAVRLANQAVDDVFDVPVPTTGEIAALFACSLHESGFGYYWKGGGVGSYNQGAIQCGPWTGDRFVYTDTHPNPDGSSSTYSACFRRYATEQKGWDDLARVMYAGRRDCVREAAINEDWQGVSAGMYSTGYYEGFGKTAADRIANHARAMAKGINRALVVLGTTPIVVPPPGAVVLERVLKRGCVGSDVKQAQMELQLAADGIFGPIMDAATKAYQLARGLTPDGIIGDKTWNALMTDDYHPPTMRSAP